MAVRKATSADVATLRIVLARAFQDDPVMACIFPDEADRRERLPPLFETWMEHIHLPHDECWTTDDRAGAALWDPPGTWRIRFIAQLSLAPRIVRVFGTRLFVALQLLDALQARHPNAPHAYLALLGADPVKQGQGIGTQLMAPMLARCDRDALPAYLESSNEKNLPFYRRHGFELLDTYDTPVGPRVWLMWREPRSGSAGTSM